MAVEFGDIFIYSWLYVLTYFPLGIIGAWRWGVWLIKKGYAAQYRPLAGKGEGVVAVVTPVYNEDPAFFRRALNSWQENGVDEIVAVIDYTNEDCVAVFQEFCQQFSGGRLIVTHTPGKRPALVDGIKAATAEFVALVDSDTLWAENVKSAALVPFHNPNVGGVATRQSVLRPTTLAQRFFNAQLNLRFLEEMPFMVARGGTVVTCISGRTAFYRRSTVLPLLPELLHETFWGKPVISGDDKRLTYLVEAAGWQVAFQQNARVFTPGMPTMPAFLKQRLRWTRNSWRADLRTLTEKWVWHHPRFALYLLDRALQPFAQLLSPIFFVVALALGLYIPALILFLWWHVGRLIRMSAYFRRAPREILLVPVFVFFNFYFALLKIYALITMNRQGWITRWDTSRLPGAPRALAAAGAYGATALVIAALAGMVMFHERSVLAALPEGAGSRAHRLTALAEAPPMAPLEHTFAEPEVIERYVVQPGDTLVGLAQRWHTAVPEIVRANAVRLPSVERVVAGLVLDKPSLHHRAVAAAVTSSYKEVGPLQVTYSADTNTITVRGRGQVVTLYTIAQRVPRQQLHELAPGEWYLSANLTIKAGVTVLLRPPEVVWLKLKSDGAEQANITLENSVLQVQDTKITSWDSAAGQADENPRDGRSYLVASNASRLDITGSEVAYLGEYPTSAGPAGATGVAWHVADQERGQSVATGEVRNSRFHHNVDGLYISGGVGLTIADNVITDNARYGLDLYDFTHDSRISGNEISTSGSHGLILSHSSTGNDLQHNRVHNNGEHGIMIHEGSHSNRLLGNEVSGQHDGIVLHHSDYTLVESNTVRGNERGMRLTAADKNILVSNEVSDNKKYGIYIDRDSHQNSVRGNILRREPTEIYILGQDTDIAENSLREGEVGIRLHQPAQGNQLRSNTFIAETKAGVYVTSLYRNFSD